MDEKLTHQESGQDDQCLRSLMKSVSNFVLYRLAFDSSQPYLLRVIFVSPSIVDLMGISDPMKFESWFEDIHPDDRARVGRANIRAFNTGKFDEIFRIYHPQKRETRWMHVVSTSSGGKNDQPMQIMGLIVDVTDQKNAEAALVESSERLKAITETGPDLIFQIDIEGKITYFSNLLESMFGYSSEEVEGNVFFEYISPRFQPSAAEAFETMLSKTPVLNLGLEILKKDGKYLQCEVSAGPIIINENIMGFQGIIRDISARKKGKIALDLYRKRLEAMVAIRSKELGESEARYRRIVEEMPEMVCRFLPDGTIIFANRACGKHLGGKTYKLIGRNFFQWISSKEEKERIEKDFKSSVEKPYPLFPSREMLLEDGSILSIHWSGHILYDDRGSLTEYQAVGRDITKEELAKEEKTRSDILHRRTQKLEAIGTLSAGIAHDFNNILAVIVGNVQLAMDDVPEENRIRGNLNEMYQACLRARDMVKQILTFAHEGDQTLMPLDLAPVIKESIRFLRHTIPSTVEIHEDLHCTDLVNADPTQINQVIMNLVTNASYAIGSEPGVLDISLKGITIDENQKDRYRVSEEGKYVKLKISDTGCGMSPQVISRVFDPYFTTKKIGEGSGMGLAVVHGIIDNHGSVIWVNSEPGKGSTFHLLFPAVEAGTAQNIDSPGQVLKGNERILLVDDEEAVLKVMIEMLGELGYEVTGTTSPIEALKAFREQPDSFDLVFTDATMPRMTGLTLTKNLVKIRPHVPVILYTGHGDLPDGDETRKSGVSAFLRKPILLKRLASTIREVLANAKRKQ